MQAVGHIVKELDEAMFDLNNRVAVVTGGGRGIGKAIALGLAQRGAKVIINFQSSEAAAQAVAKEIDAQGGSADIAGFDVGDPEAVETAFRDLVKKHERLDILVNNAGISRDQLLLRVNLQQLEETFRTNVNGVVFCAKSAIRPMMKARFGRIINMSSVVGETGNLGQTVYSASKGAIINLTKTLAREYASRGVTVNAVTPGFIETDMTANLPKEALQAAVQQTPLGRVGTPNEVAAAVVFLASEESSYITGQVLRVNGGMYM